MRALKPILFGMVGMALALLAWEAGSHLWQDHRDFHVMRAWVVEVQKAAAAQVAPASE